MTNDRIIFREVKLGAYCVTLTCSSGNGTVPVDGPFLTSTSGRVRFVRPSASTFHAVELGQGCPLKSGMFSVEGGVAKNVVRASRGERFSRAGGVTRLPRKGLAGNAIFLSGGTRCQC